MITIKCKVCGKKLRTQLKNKQGFFDTHAIRHWEIQGWVVNLRVYAKSVCPDCNLFKK